MGRALAAAFCRWGLVDAATDGDERDAQRGLTTAKCAAGEESILNPELSAFLRSWSWDPVLLGGLALSGVIYLAGWRALAKRSGGRSVLRAWRAWSFFAGLASIWIALLSPIEVYSELFFFMHMIQHLILVEISAPLLLLGAPLLPVMWALPRDARVGMGRLFTVGPLHSLFSALTSPLTAVTVYCAALSIWHIPEFYDAAQGRTLMHDFEHAIFVGAALLFWWPVIHPAGGRRRLSYLGGLIYFVPPMSVGSLIGALLTFAQHPIYATYQKVPRVWGISVLQDQQFAGLIMWVPGGLFFAIPVFTFLVLLLRESPPPDLPVPGPSDTLTGTAGHNSAAE